MPDGPVCLVLEYLADKDRAALRATSRRTRTLGMARSATLVVPVSSGAALDLACAHARDPLWWGRHAQRVVLVVPTAHPTTRVGATTALQADGMRATRLFVALLGRTCPLVTDVTVLLCDRGLWLCATALPLVALDAAARAWPGAALRLHQRPTWHWRCRCERQPKKLSGADLPDSVRCSLVDCDLALWLPHDACVVFPRLESANLSVVGTDMERDGQLVQAAAMRHYFPAVGRLRVQSDSVASVAALVRAIAALPGTVPRLAELWVRYDGDPQRHVAPDVSPVPNAPPIDWLFCEGEHTTGIRDIRALGPTVARAVCSDVPAPEDLRGIATLCLVVRTPFRSSVTWAAWGRLAACADELVALTCLSIRHVHTGALPLEPAAFVVVGMAVRALLAATPRLETLCLPLSLVPVLCGLVRPIPVRRLLVGTCLVGEEGKPACDSVVELADLDLASAAPQLRRLAIDADLAPAGLLALCQSVPAGTELCDSTLEGDLIDDGLHQCDHAGSGGWPCTASRPPVHVLARSVRLTLDHFGRTGHPTRLDSPDADQVLLDFMPVAQLGATEPDLACSFPRASVLTFITGPQTPEAVTAIKRACIGMGARLRLLQVRCDPELLVRFVFLDPVVRRACTWLCLDARSMHVPLGCPPLPVTASPAADGGTGDDDRSNWLDEARAVRRRWKRVARAARQRKR